MNSAFVTTEIEEDPVLRKFASFVQAQTIEIIEMLSHDFLQRDICGSLLIN